MSQSSPFSLPRRKYGAVQGPEVGHLAAINPPHRTTAAGHQRRHGRRRLGLIAAVALSAAIAGLAYNRQRPATAQPSNAGAVSFIDVVAPVTQTSDVHIPKASFPTPTAAAAETATGGLAPLSFEALNFYHVRDGKPALDYPWLKDMKLIEPHRDTTLSVSSPRDGYEYIWEVRGGDSDKGDLRATASGAETVVVLTMLDDNMITLKEVNSDGEVVRQLDEMVMVKYVRREIRTLTDDEREEVLDAVSVRCGCWDREPSPIAFTCNANNEPLQVSGRRGVGSQAKARLKYKKHANLQIY